MKSKDILLIGVVVFISGLASYFVSGKVISPPKNRKQQVEVVEAISTEFKQPDPKFFNSNSIDPTKLIQIGDNTNPTPFNKQ